MWAENTSRTTPRFHHQGLHYEIATDQSDKQHYYSPVAKVIDGFVTTQQRFVGLGDSINARLQFVLVGDWMKEKIPFHGSINRSET